ncbi:MAG: hypothetical protein JWL66_350 [Sphingomonadales bacterium]|nr:hypothetical protein [Sphingomonadales bacterium]
MNTRLINWIWHVRGSVPLAPAQSSADAFDRLDPLFREFGTSHERVSDTLIFRKKNQPAQDKMSIFDSGVLKIEKGSTGPVLRYHLTSRALLFCFLMPLMFLGVAQFTIALAKFEKPATEAAKKHTPKPVVVPLNPIDKALGAPEPEKPKKDKDKKKDEDKKPSPTPAYVFAAIFATLYGVGRVLEARLVRSLFKKRLLAA